jgi:hypothetical protein
LRIGHTRRLEDLTFKMGYFCHENEQKLMISPVQDSESRCVGYDAYVPESANPSALEEAIMEGLKFSRSIGLKYEWVEDGKRWNANKKGVLAWHIYTKEAQAKSVSLELLSWFSTSTPCDKFP